MLARDIASIGRKTAKQITSLCSIQQNAFDRFKEVQLTISADMRLTLLIDCYSTDSDWISQAFTSCITLDVPVSVSE